MGRQIRIEFEEDEGEEVTCIRVRRGVVVLDYRDAAGQRRSPSFGPKTDDESWIKAKAAKRRLRYLDDDDAETLFEDAWAMWLDDLREQVDGATRQRYLEAGQLYLAPSFNGLRLARIRRRTIKSAILERLAEKKKDGITPRFARVTVRKRILGVLANFLQWCVDEEMIETNPARELGRRLFRKKGAESPAPKAMTTEQMVKWTVATETLVDGRTFLGLMLMLDGALRIGEMLGLRLEDFDFEGSMIHVRRQVRSTGGGAIVKAPKTAQGVRDIPMSTRIKEHAQADLRARAAEALATGRKANPWIGWDFTESPTVQESSVARKHYQRAMGRLCKAAGIERFTPHGLRHTWGTIQAEHGAQQKALQSWYGHASSSMTDHYIQHARPQLGAEQLEPAGPNLLETITEKRRPRVEPFESASSRAR